jgi:fatty acid desaturase
VGTDEVSVSRHVDAGMAEAFVISPFHINYHTAHHLFPSVPWYNLPALHARLMEEAAYRERLVCASSYTGPGGVLDTLMPSTTESKATLGTAVAQ